MISSKEQKPAPFIVGVPRSGTTLLRSMLNSHPELSIPKETDFPITELFNNQNNIDFHDKVKEYIFNSRNWGLSGLDQKNISDKIDAMDPFAVSDALRVFYKSHAQQFSKERYGDKTPQYCSKMWEINEILPEAHFIHIIRDGRAVASSMKDLWFGPGNDMKKQAVNWMEIIEKTRNQSKKVEHYLEVRYEDLVSNPESILREICEFIDIEFSPDMLMYYTEASRKKNIFNKPKNTQQSLKKNKKGTGMLKLLQNKPEYNRINAWKVELSQGEIEEFEDVAGDLLKELEYKSTTRLVSVCIVTHNDENNIYSSVASLLDQAYNDLEIIIVDDCSADKTVEIVESIDDDKIRLIKNDKKLGVIMSRKIALEHVHGDYIAIMSPEYISVARRIQMQVRVLEKGFDFCGGWELRVPGGLQSVQTRVFKALSYEMKEVGGFIVKTPESAEEIKVKLLFGVPIIDETIMFSKTFLCIAKRLYEQNSTDTSLNMLLGQLLLQTNVRCKNIQKVLICYKRDAKKQAVSQNFEQEKEMSSIFQELDLEDHVGMKMHYEISQHNYDTQIDVQKLSDFYNQIIQKNRTYKLFNKYVLLFHIEGFIEQCNIQFKNNEDIKLLNGTQIAIKPQTYGYDITFIVPFHNVQRFLKQCLDSIRFQDDCNFEVIMIDDGSTDRSAEIAKKYIKDKRFIYVFQEQAGVGSARNIGINRARGKYIAFVDADDYIVDDFCKKTLSEVGDHDILVFGQRAFDEYSERVDDRFCPERNILRDEDIFPLYAKGSFGHPVWNKIYRSELIKKVRFDESIFQSEDLLFCMELFAQARSVQTIDYIGYMYRQRSGSLTKVRSKLNIDGTIKLEKTVDTIFQKYSLDTRFENECAKLKVIYLHAIFNHVENNVIYEKDPDYLQFSLMKKFVQKDKLMQNQLDSQNEILKNMQRDLAQIQQKRTKANDVNNGEATLLSNENEISKLKQVIQRMEQENRDLKNSKSFKLGDLFFRSMKNPYKLIAFPINLINILFQK